MKSNVLVLAPHTDDGEFGCGGTIAKYIEMGHRVIYVAFSAAEQSSEELGYPRDILRREVKAATARLGIAKEDCIVLQFPVRHFQDKRQEILDQMIHLSRDFRPRVVFMPSVHDTHQDHEVIAREGFRAFKKTTILGYEAPWNNLTFTTSCFNVIKKEHLDTKIEALKCYESQYGRSYATEDFIRSLAITRGTQIGQHFAEAFEAVRVIDFC